MLATKKKPTLAGGTRPPSDRKPSGDRKNGVAPATFYRIREHGVRLGLDPRLATVLGRMGLFNELSTVEVDAGFRIAEIYGAYESLNGIPRRHAASPSYQRGFGSKDVDTSRMTPDEVVRFERRQRRSRKAFDKLQLMFPHDAARDLIERACCNNEEIGPVLKPKLAILLHGIAVKMGLAQETVTKSKKTVERADDGALLAQASVEALIQWFENQASKPTHFSLVENRDWKRVRGITATDGRFHHTIAVPLRHLSVKQIDAQLRLACAVKGLLELKDAETGEVA